MSKRVGIWIIVLFALVSVGPALAAPPKEASYAANPNADQRFGLGVAVRAGTSSDAYGKTDINQNDRDAISLLGLNANAKTWAVYQPELNSDVNYILASYTNYPDSALYDGDLNDVPEGYTGSNWNLASSSEQGSPGVGTFIVTQVALKDATNCQNPNDPTDVYCIYGLTGQPVTWGQDPSQPGGMYLDAPTGFCSVPETWRKYFKSPSPPGCLGSDPSYNPVGMISVPGSDLWSAYPSYSGYSAIHDIRVPRDYWVGVGGYIVYGAFYNPQTYKGVSYASYGGAFKRFIAANRDANPTRERIYAFLNFPDAKDARWDANPMLPESYSWHMYNHLQNGIKTIDSGAKFMIPLGSASFTDPAVSEPCPGTPAPFYPQQLVSNWHTKGYAGNFPVDYWGYTVYGGIVPTISYSSIVGNSGKDGVLQAWAKLVECRARNLGTVSNGSQVTNLMLMEISAGVADASFDDAGVLRQSSNACDLNCSYPWEYGVFFGTGKWLKPLASAYPNLVHFSIQPTFNIPQYQWGYFVPSTRQESYAQQTLSPTSTGTAAGWSQAALPGGSALYISPPTVGNITNGKTVTISYYNDDGAMATGEAQLVINDVPAWFNYGTKPTKYGIRVMYTPRQFGSFNGNKMYVYTECAQGSGGCVYGWTELANDGTWYTQTTLKYKTKIQVSTPAPHQLSITYSVELLSGSPFSNTNMNLFGFAEVDDPTKYDLSAGSGYKVTQGTYYANFKKLGGIVFPIVP